MLYINLNQVLELKPFQLRSASPYTVDVTKSQVYVITSSVWTEPELWPQNSAGLVMGFCDQLKQKPLFVVNW